MQTIRTSARTGKMGMFLRLVGLETVPMPISYRKSGLLNMTEGCQYHDPMVAICAVSGVNGSGCGNARASPSGKRITCQNKWGAYMGRPLNGPWRRAFFGAGPAHAHYHVTVLEVQQVRIQHQEYLVALIQLDAVAGAGSFVNRN